MTDRADVKPWKAIAAMSLNRVIGHNNQLPWHIPEDFRWFKSQTLGHTLVMGRNTFQSIGKPLPGRRTIVLSRSQFQHPGVQVIQGLAELDELPSQGTIFICGGAALFAQALPSCSVLLLTLVKRQVVGDVFFPPFEHQFVLHQTISETSEFQILEYRNRSLAPAP